MHIINLKKHLKNMNNLIDLAIRVKLVEFFGSLLSLLVLRRNSSKIKKLVVNGKAHQYKYRFVTNITFRSLASCLFCPALVRKLATGGVQKLPLHTYNSFPGGRAVPGVGCRVQPAK